MRAAFLSFCEDLAPASYAQRFQDLFCLWISGLKHDGYFVEFGALSGINVSNSYLLERLGWDGIVAEPHPAFADRLRANRRARVVTDCVWSESGATVPFHAVKGKPALSGIGGLGQDDIQAVQGSRAAFVRHDVRTISLKDMLDQAKAPRVIDAISIDTEGSEFEILKAFDFTAYRFRAIVVEHGFSAMRPKIHALLSDHGYLRLWPELSGHDDWYVHAAHLPESPPDAGAYRALIRALPTDAPLPKPGPRLRVLAEMAQAIGHRDLRLRCLQQAAAALPDVASVHSELARAFGDLGLTNRAIAAFDAALALNPDLAPARKCRARMLDGADPSPAKERAR
nr:FkbM family methyltransferase [Hasllibacter sp. MH4015]